jgi:hypothetical protein
MRSVISLLCIVVVAGVSSVQAFLGSGVPLAVGLCARAQLFFNCSCRLLFSFANPLKISVACLSASKRNAAAVCSTSMSKVRQKLTHEACDVKVGQNMKTRTQCNAWMNPYIWQDDKVGRRALLFTTLVTGVSFTSKANVSFENTDQPVVLGSNVESMFFSNKLGGRGDFQHVLPQYHP